MWLNLVTVFVSRNIRSIFTTTVSRQIHIFVIIIFLFDYLFNDAFSISVHMSLAF